MENKLDNFFKNKLDEREIVFNEAHWEQAQFMLDKQDEKERRRAWWQYWILGLLGLVLLSGLTFYLTNETGTDRPAKETSLGVEATPNDYQAMPANEAKVATEQTNAATSPAQVVASATNKTSATENEPAFLNEKTIEQKVRTVPNHLVTRAESNQQMTSNLNAIAKTIVSTNTHQNDDTKVVQQSKQERRQGNNLDITEKQHLILDTQQGQITRKSIAENGLQMANLSEPKEEQKNREQTTKTETEKLEEEKSTTRSSDLIVMPDDESNKEGKATLSEKQGFMVVKNLHEDIASIPTLHHPLSLPTKELGDAVPKIVAPAIIKPATQKGWRLGITASTLLYPFSNTSELQFAEFPDINPAVTAQQWVGFKLGATARYHLNQRWAVSAGLLYYKQTGTFQSVRSSRRVTYRFGLESTTVDLVPQSLHYLEMPILISRKYHKHSIELGGAVDLLLGVNNTIGTYENIGDDELVLTPQKSTWKYQDGFSRRHVRALLGYQYQVLKSLHLGLRINYAIGGGILDSNYSASFSGSSSRFILLESRPTNVELKMTYYW